MGKKNRGLAVYSPAPMAMPGPVAPTRMKKKHLKAMAGGGGGDGQILADDVEAMAWEYASAMAIQKFYFGNALETAGSGPPEKGKGGGDESKKESKRKVCFQHLIGAVVARRMLKKGSLLHNAARGLGAVAAVNLAQNM